MYVNRKKWLPTDFINNDRKQILNPKNMRYTAADGVGDDLALEEFWVYTKLNNNNT